MKINIGESSLEIVNLTPHAITLRGEGAELTIPPSGGVARVLTRETVVGDLIGIPVITRVMGRVEGLPDQRDGVAYIVSSMVLEALRGMGRRDIYAPDTGPTAIRDEQGRIVAVTRLVATV